MRLRRAALLARQVLLPPVLTERLKRLVPDVLLGWPPTCPSCGRPYGHGGRLPIRIRRRSQPWRPTPEYLKGQVLDDEGRAVTGEFAVIWGVGDEVMSSVHTHPGRMPR